MTKRNDPDCPSDRKIENAINNPFSGRPRQTFRHCKKCDFCQVRWFLIAADMRSQTKTHTQQGRKGIRR